MSVTAVLITFNRQPNIGRIVDFLSSRKYVSEILIRDNAKLDNCINYGRYKLAAKAENDVIVTCDDDCIVENLDKIYEVFLAQPDRIAFGLRPEHYELWKAGQFTYDGKYMTAMAGWGMFFNRSWCQPDHLTSKSVFRSYLDQYGYDALFFREADRIFSLLLRRLHNPVVARITHLPGAESDEALWRQPDHTACRAEAIRRCLNIVREKP